jgi:hypothetical protein
LELICTIEVEVWDILTELDPADAGQVDASEHATVVAGDAVRVLAGAIRRDLVGLPLPSRSVRQRRGTRPFPLRATGPLRRQPARQVHAVPEVIRAG